MSLLQTFIASLAAWKDTLCVFFASAVNYIQHSLWSTFRRTPGYDDLINFEPSLPPSPHKGGSDIGPTDDLESGLNDVPLPTYKRVRPPSASLSLPRTPGTAAPTTNLPVPVLTSSFLSAFLLEGRGITLSPSARVMLSSGVWSPDISMSSNFGYGQQSLQGFDDGEDTKICSPSQTALDVSPDPTVQHNLSTLTTLGGSSIGFSDISKASPRPRPPSGVRHSLRFSTLPQPVSRPLTEFVPNTLPLSHSMASFISLPGVSGIFRGGLVVDGDDVHLPTSLSSPEPRYHEFFYEYYCQEPVLPLDAPTEDAIRLSLLTFSPVLAIPPVAELSDLNIHFPRDGDDDDESPLSSTPRIPSTTLAAPHERLLQSHEKALTTVSATSLPSASDLWHTPLTSRIPSIESAVSAPFFLFPAFQSPSIATALGTLGKGIEERGLGGGQGDAETTIAISSSSSSSFYTDSDTGSTRELGNDSDRTLQTFKQARYRKAVDLGVSVSPRSEGSSTSGSDNSSETSGEATLVHAKHGSLVKPVVIMRVPGTRESFILHSNSRSEELNLPVANAATQQAMEVAVPAEHNIERSLRVSHKSCIEARPSVHPARSGGGASDADDDGSVESEDESSVKWLAWPHGSKQGAGARKEETGREPPSPQDVPKITQSPPHLATTLSDNRRQVLQAPSYNPRPYFDTRRSSPTLQSNLHQLIVPHIQDFIPAKLPECHGPTSTEYLASLSASPQASPTLDSSIRPCIIIQVNGTHSVSTGGPGGMIPPQAPFAELDHGPGGGRTLNAGPPALSDLRYPTFIPANDPSPNPKRKGRARAKSVPTRLRNEIVDEDQDHYDEEYESALRVSRELDLQSSGSNETVCAAEIQGSFTVTDSLLLGIGDDRKPRRRTRHILDRRRKTDAVDRGRGGSGTFIAPGEDSGQDDVPSDYSGACAL